MIEIVKIKKAYNFIMSFLLFAGMGGIVALLLMIFSKDFIADVESVITMVLVFFSLCG